MDRQRKVQDTRATKWLLGNNYPEMGLTLKGATGIFGQRTFMMQPEGGIFMLSPAKRSTVWKNKSKMVT
jgi:hypothetical protein